MNRKMSTFILEAAHFMDIQFFTRNTNKNDSKVKWKVHFSVVVAWLNGSTLFLKLGWGKEQTIENYSKMSNPKNLYILRNIWINSEFEEQNL